MTKIYTYSVKQRVKAFYIDAQAINRLDELYELMESMKEMLTILRDLFGKKGYKATSLRLKQLTGIKNIVKHDADVEMKSQSDEEEKSDGEEQADGIYPNYEPIFQEFNNLIQWKTVGKSKVPEPILGIDEEFDEKNQVVDQIKEKINAYVEDVSKETGCKDVKIFESLGKFRY